MADSRGIAVSHPVSFTGAFPPWPWSWRYGGAGARAAFCFLSQTVIPQGLFAPPRACYLPSLSIQVKYQTYTCLLGGLSMWVEKQGEGATK